MGTKKAYIVDQNLKVSLYAIGVLYFGFLLQLDSDILHGLFFAIFASLERMHFPTTEITESLAAKHITNANESLRDNPYVKQDPGQFIDCMEAIKGAQKGPPPHVTMK